MHFRFLQKSRWKIEHFDLFSSVKLCVHFLTNGCLAASKGYWNLWLVFTIILTAKTVDRWPYYRPFRIEHLPPSLRLASSKRSLSRDAAAQLSVLFSAHSKVIPEHSGASQLRIIRILDCFFPSVIKKRGGLRFKFHGEFLRTME